MSDRPIIFSAPMVNALLDGRKSMTRRVLKSQPPEWVTRMCHEGRNGWIGSGDGHGTLMHVPYAVGDRLWCREAWSGAYQFRNVPPSQRVSVATPDGPILRDDIWYWADGNPEFGDYERPRPSIHMPRWASRLTLTVTNVRVERLNSITEANAVAEGIEPGRRLSCGGMSHTAVDIFCDIWTSIHGPEAWALNPWCAVLSFTVHRCNIDQMPGGDHE